MISPGNSIAPSLLPTQVQTAEHKIFRLSPFGPGAPRELLAGSLFILPKNMKQPESTVKIFIRAHAQWNQRSNSRCKLLRPGSVEKQRAMEIAKSEYQEIIQQLASKDVVPQPISFGDDGMHDPERESIQSVHVEETMAIIRSRHIGMYDIVSIYEYRLVKESNEWRISSLLYVDDDGSYECL